MSKYPIYLELKNKLAVVIGAGSVAARKAETLAATGAIVRIVALTFKDSFDKLSSDPSIEVIRDAYSEKYIQDAFLVIAATDDNALNTEIFEACRKNNILCNVVDVPHLCNFYVPAVVKRGDLQIAISTNGKCPAYAGHLRRKLQELITQDHGEFVDVLDEIRHSVIKKIIPKNRKKLLAKLADDNSYNFFRTEGVDAWKLMAEDLVKDAETVN